MSATTWMPLPDFTSELIQRGGCVLPQPQLSRFIFSFCIVGRDVGEYFREKFIRIEIFLRQCAGGATMMRVIGGNLRRAFDRVVESGECHQALAGRQMPTESGVLNQCWFAGREISSAAVAEPAAASRDVDRLGDGEFGARILEVTAKSIWSSCTFR